MSSIGLLPLWFAAATVSAPLGIVLHELAHLLAALVFGFEAPRLHYASVDYGSQDEFWQAFHNQSPAAAAAILSPAAVGITALAGVVATWLLSLGAAFAAVRLGARGFIGAMFAALAMTAGVRGIAGLIYLLSASETRARATPNFDEFNAAVTLNIPLLPLVAIGLTVTLACWIVLVPRMRPTPILQIVAMLAGFAGGVVAWAEVGPLFVP